LTSAFRAVAGHLVFPAPSSVLAVTDRTLEVFPGSRRRLASRDVRIRRVRPDDVDPHGLGLFFRALVILLELLATSEKVPSSSSRGIRPLHTSLPFDRLCVHSRRPKPPSGRRYHPSTHVPSSWSLTTSTAYSTQGLRVCCTPLPAMRFDAFPVPASSAPESALQVLRVPRAAGHTLRRVPLISSRTTSLWPLPSCLCYTFSLPGPARPKPSEASSLQPKLWGRCPRAAAGRSRCQRGAAGRAEAFVAAHNLSGRSLRSCGASRQAETFWAAHAPAGRSRRGCFASIRAEALVVAFRRTSEEIRRDGPDYPATEAAVRPPRGSMHLTDRGR
jgi:hypothetical protein